MGVYLGAFQPTVSFIIDIKEAFSLRINWRFISPMLVDSWMRRQSKSIGQKPISLSLHPAALAVT
jgi:hypothetical protein